MNGDEELKTHVALIKQDLAHIRELYAVYVKKLEEDRDTLRKSINVLHSKVVSTKEFDSHVKQDRMIQGGIFASIVAAFVKMFMGGR